MRALRTFDQWADAGPFRPVDLGRFRVAYALTLLLMLPTFDWVSGYPQSFFAPPPGPFRLLDGLPAGGTLTALGLVLTCALVALALGIGTTTASLLTGATLLTGFGMSFSLGKIDHTILAVLVPLVLAAARWGDTVSVDALRRDPATTPESNPQWPLRLLALLISLGYLTAVLPKLLNGWLDPRTQAVRAYALGAGDSPLVPVELLLGLPNAVWEGVDWATVLFEVYVVLAIINWRAFRLALAVAAVFHLSVHLMLGILFELNVLAYGAFIAWGAIPLPRLRPGIASAVRRAAPLLVFPGGGAVVVLVQTFGNAQEVVAPVLVWTGAAVGVAYVLTQVRSTLVRGRTAARDTHGPPPRGVGSHTRDKADEAARTGDENGRRLVTGPSA